MADKNAEPKLVTPHATDPVVHLVDHPDHPVTTTAPVKKFRPIQYDLSGRPIAPAEPVVEDSHLVAELLKAGWIKGENGYYHPSPQEYHNEQFQRCVPNVDREYTALEAADIQELRDRSGEIGALNERRKAGKLAAT